MNTCGFKVFHHERLNRIHFPSTVSRMYRYINSEVKFYTSSVSFMASHSQIINKIILPESYNFMPTLNSNTTSQIT